MTEINNSISIFIVLHKKTEANECKLHRAIGLMNYITKPDQNSDE